MCLASAVRALAAGRFFFCRRPGRPRLPGLSCARGRDGLSVCIRSYHAIWRMELSRASWRAHTLPPPTRPTGRVGRVGGGCVCARGWRRLAPGPRRGVCAGRTGREVHGRACIASVVRRRIRVRHEGRLVESARSGARTRAGHGLLSDSPSESRAHPQSAFGPSPGSKTNWAAGRGPAPGRTRPVKVPIQRTRGCWGGGGRGERGELCGENVGDGGAKASGERRAVCYGKMLACAPGRLPADPIPRWRIDTERERERKREMERWRESVSESDRDRQMEIESETEEGDRSGQTGREGGRQPGRRGGPAARRGAKPARGSESVAGSGRNTDSCGAWGRDGV